MKLKIIIFPFVLIMTIIMAVSFIYPEYQKIQSSLAEIKIKEATLSELEDKSQNVKKLSENLESNAAEKDFVLKYLPDKRNEEVIVDRSNYLTVNSSTLLVNVDLEKPSKTVVQGLGAEEQAIQARDAAFSGSVDQAEPQPEIPVTVDLIGSTIEIIGTYENVKNYLNRLYRIESWFNVSALEIEIASSDDDSAEEAGAENQGSNEIKNLVARYSLDFGYLPETSVKANRVPQIFSEAEFDFTAADKAKEISTSAIPDIDAGSYGSRVDPFFP